VTVRASASPGHRNEPIQGGREVESVKTIILKLCSAAVVLLALLIVLGMPAPASAAVDPGCTALNGDDTTVPGECQVSAAVTVAGTVTLGETLHMLNGGVINVGAVPAGGLTLNIT
jgi:hypothetical protein